MNIAVFSSHNGTDLQAIIDACKSVALDASVCVVISNNKNSMALERAKNAGIDNHHASVKVYGDEDILDEKIISILDSHIIDIIFLASYLKKIMAESLASKVLEQEHIFIVEVLNNIISGKIILGTP